MPLFFYWFICVLIGVLAFFWAWKKDKLSKNKFKWLPSVTRGLIAFILTALLLVPAIKFKKNTTQLPVILYLQDNSTSFKDGLKDSLNEYESKKESIKDNLASNYKWVDLSFSEQLDDELQGNYDGVSTNIDRALSQAYQRYKGANLGAMIIATDGIYNEGLDPNYSGLQFDIPIYTIAIGDSTFPKDISVNRVFANKVVQVGNSFEIAADLRFTKFSGSQHNVQLLLNNQIIQTKQQSINEDDQYIGVSFEVEAKSPGFFHYSIQVPEAIDEKSFYNNRIDFYVQVVSNETKIAIINGGTHPDIGFIHNALSTSMGFKIEVLSPNSIPNDFKLYNALILHQPNLNEAQWDKINTAKLPSWHILGNQTSTVQLQNLKGFMNVGQMRPSSFLTPVFQSHFATFLMPISAGSVFSKLPPLESSVAQAKFNFDNEILIQAKENNQPIWMVHNGATPLAITIGEGLWRWGVFEYKEFKSQLITQELIRQTMRILNVPKEDKPFQVYLSKRLMNDNENISFTAELKNKSGQLVNDAIVQLIIQDSLGVAKEFEFEKFGNSYQIIVPKMGAGLYNYSGRVSYQGNNYSDQGTFAVENIPLEQLNTRANYELLYQLSQNSNGSFFTYENMLDVVDKMQQNKNIKSRIVSEENSDPFIDYKWIFLALLLLLTFEWYFRKYWTMQ